MRATHHALRVNVVGAGLSQSKGRVEGSQDDSFVDEHIERLVLLGFEWWVVGVRMDVCRRESDA